MVRCLHQTDIDNSVCAKLFRASVFDEKLRFRQGRFEDLDIIYRVFDRTHRVCLVNACVYYYRRNPEGFINNPQAGGRYDVLDVCSRILQYTQLYSTRVKRAAHARTLAASMNILSLLYHYGIDEPEVEKRCYRYMRLYRRSVLWNKRARRRDRMGALLAYSPRFVIRRALLRHDPLQ